MTDSPEKEREDRALDALIVMAFRPDLADLGPLPDLSDPALLLSPEDQAALDARLGPDLVARILAEHPPASSSPKNPKRRKKTRRRSRPAGSLHRSDGGEVTEKARAEMERRIREREAEREKAKRQAREPEAGSSEGPLP
jgi:hypothetical protein